MKRIFPLILSGLIIAGSVLTVKAADIEEPFKMYTTAYCQGTTTYTGVPVRAGICAVKKEWIYKCEPDGSLGEFLGYWECLDTGFGGDADEDGVGSIEDGRVIDMYFPTLEECKNWMKLTGGKVYVQLIDAEG